MKTSSKSQKISSVDVYRTGFMSKSWRKRLKKYRLIYLLVVPALVATFIFNYIPMYGVQIAFKDFSVSKGIWGSDWVGFEHFIRFFTYPNFWTIISNTLIISFYSLLTFPIPVIFSLMLNEVDNLKLKKSIQMITYAPHFVSVVVVCSMITLFLARSNGVINNALEFFGFARYDFLSDPSAFADIFVWSGVWQGLGWGTIIYLGALADVPTDLIEAAKIDGASRFQIVKKINVPHILPMVITMLILRCGQLANVGFDKVYLLQNSLNLTASRVISTYVYEIGIQGGQFSYASAIGLFNNIINIVLILTVNYLSKKFTDIGLF